MPECFVRETKWNSLAERSKGAVNDGVVSDGENDQDDHEHALWERASLSIWSRHEEEQGTETELLDIHPNEQVLNRLWEEQASCVSRGRLRVLVKEEVLVEEVEKEKCKA
jgi:hypothetical protein